MNFYIPNLRYFMNFSIPNLRYFMNFYIPNLSYFMNFSIPHFRMLAVTYTSSMTCSEHLCQDQFKCM